jgi:hypothetical protein
MVFIKLRAVHWSGQYHGRQGDVWRKLKINKQFWEEIIAYIP